MPPNTHAIFNRKNKMRSMTLPDIVYKAVVIRIAWYSYQNTDTNQWDRMESPEGRRGFYKPIACSPASDDTYLHKGNLLGTCCQENWISMLRS